MTNGATVGDAIRLETSRGRRIPNYHVSEVSSWELRQLGTLSKKHPDADPRCSHTGIYNCFGMVFASRRACVDEDDAIRDILNDDRYKMVGSVEKNDFSNVLSGDLILYYEDDGRFSHAGVVVTAPSEKTMNIPLIVSKWGRGPEYIHLATHCEEDYSTATFWRVIRDD